MTDTDTLPDKIKIVPDIDRPHLNTLQLQDYREHRERVLTWLWERGKNPDDKDGYSTAVVENTAYRLPDSTARSTSPDTASPDSSE